MTDSSLTPAAQATKRLHSGKPPKIAIPIEVSEVTFSGSLEQCVRISFSANLNQKQRDFVENSIRAHECNDDVYQIRWSGRKIVVIEVTKKSLPDCSRVDVERAVREMARKIPVDPR